MSDWVSGAGWREVTYEQWRGDTTPAHEDTAYLRVGTEDHYFWREAPVSPLPTSPNTVIRVDWHDGNTEVMVYSGADWHRMFGGLILTNSELLKRIKGFVVLSEPPAVTAKTVLLAAWDEIAGDNALGGEVWDSFGLTARQFGVES